MSTIKQDLKNIVSDNLIPDVEKYLYELYKLLEANKANEDDIEAMRDVESFLVELENIVLIVNEDKLTNNKAQEVYNNIVNLIEESKLLKE
ncbi:MAG: hypothetical protein GY932_02120 [Arcobacter sp.]|nr:hypothetical protein [Arcobacter sp.]